ncbi:hypothetical protein [Alkalihalophilus marmarensis]|uniref:hypothetical protein n=1 Tax=Alkalihalophilus marmarensis TaxID=521377 RepID=UPI002DBD7907|nr:hypothetical protein [Alkalihalophilus marmarensis]MEC2072510.1 hypothetical protein [Alkalihalophilus marmarensis]
MEYNEPKLLSKTLSFIKEAEKVKKQLEDEIKAYKLVQSKDGTINQLKNFYKDVELMIKSNNHNPSYPRVFTETWDYNSELVIQLLNLYELYKKVG